MVQGELTKTVRYGVETVRGTAVTCTNILDIATAEWDLIPATIRSDNLTGGVFPSPVVTPGVIIPRVRVTLGSINWDKWQRWLAAGVDGAIASAGAGADKTWGSNAIKPPALSTGGALTEALKSYTLEVGYANPAAAMPAHKIPGCIVDRIKIIWNRVGFVTAELDFVSIFPVVDITSYTGTLSPDTMSASVPDHTMFACYIDTSTIGSTLDTTVVGGELEWRSFMAPDENAKRLTFSQPSELSLTLTRFHEAAGILSAARTKALQKIRVQSTGPVLGTGTWVLGADVYGQVESRPLTTIGGFVAEELNVTSRYDATAASDIAFRLVNSSATL